MSAGVCEDCCVVKGKESALDVIRYKEVENMTDKKRNTKGMKDF